MTSKPHMVLVPGAWHTAEAYHKLMPYLQNAGYGTTALTLPGVLDDSPPKTFDEDVQLISATIKSLTDAGQDVVCVFHSYGGVPGTEAMRGFAKKNQQPGKAGVSHLVYLSAWMVQEGSTLVEARGSYPSPASVHARMVDGRSQFLAPLEFFYHDVPKEEGEEVATELRWQSMGNLGTKLTYGASKDIPSTYLLCRNDRMIVYEKQKELVANARAAGGQVDTVECDSGHSPFLSMPEFTARVIRRAAGDDIEV